MYGGSGRFLRENTQLSTVGFDFFACGPVQQAGLEPVRGAGSYDLHERLNFREKKKPPQKLSGEYSLNFAEIFITLASTKLLIFIAIACVVSLLWQRFH